MWRRKRSTLPIEVRIDINGLTHDVNRDRLATYNDEVARGIVHTASYAAEMALLQGRSSRPKAQSHDPWSVGYRPAPKVMPVGASQLMTRDPYEDRRW